MDGGPTDYFIKHRDDSRARHLKDKEEWTMKGVKEVLGHASIQTTMDKYGSMSADAPADMASY